MVLLPSSNVSDVYKLDTNIKTQQEISKYFSSATEEMVQNKTPICFDGNYKPINDEYLVIDNFILHDSIKDAIRSPLGVQSFSKINNSFPEIKTIFIGKREEEGEFEKFQIAFQRMRKEQYLSPKGINIFFKNNTFV
jgi:hypothetical protein